MSEFKYMRHCITTVDNMELILHSWIAIHEKTTLFYIHGMQSHGEWLFETGPYLAKKGITVHVMDRRGSGESGGLRGDVESINKMMKDYKLAFEYVKKNHIEHAINVMGQSLGGSILLGLIESEYLQGFSKAIFCAPALGQLHNRLDDDELKIRLSLVGKGLSPVNLEFNDYTQDDTYLKFIYNDDKVVDKITDDSKRTFLQVENIYFKSEKKCKNSSLFIAPRCDPIIDIKGAEEVFRNHFPNGILLELPAQEHYLEFTCFNKVLWNTITNYLIED